MNLFDELRKLIDLNLTTEAYVLACDRLAIEYGNEDLAWIRGMMAGVLNMQNHAGHLTPELAAGRRVQYKRMMLAAESVMPENDFRILRSII